MTNDADDQPPILKTWSRAYVLVIGALVVTIALFTAITRYFE